MPELKKTLQSKMKIRFHDCDPFHHLNNSRYIDYIVTARGDQLLKIMDLIFMNWPGKKELGG
jgi:acyl-CoA thioester hydrolase